MTTQLSEPRPIPTPGIYYDVPAAEYFAWDACNASTLKKMSRSAAHARWEIDNPPPPTPAMIMGSVTHTAVLEPDKLKFRYCFADECAGIKGSGEKCSNQGLMPSGGKWYCGVHSKGKYRDDLHGMEVVTSESLATAQAMAISVRKNRAATELLDASKKEVCIVWIDPVTEILCKARLDAYDESGLRVADLKTCEDASPDEFPRQIGDMGYDIQASFYLDAATSLNGELHDAFYFIAVEKSAPFVCAVYKSHQSMIQLGRNRYRQMLADYKWCVENNLFPGYHDHQIQPVSVTRYFYEREMHR